MNPGRVAISTISQVVASVPPDVLTCAVSESSLVLRPQDGHEVRVYDEGEQMMVASQRWHTHFDSADEGVACALWLLTPYFRIVEEYKGGLMAATWVERFGLEGWEGSDPVYFLNPEYAPDWALAEHETYTHRRISQAVLWGPAPYAQVVPGVELDDAGLPPGFVPGVEVIVVAQPFGPGLFEPEA